MMRYMLILMLAIGLGTAHADPCKAPFTKYEPRLKALFEQGKKKEGSKIFVKMLDEVESAGCVEKLGAKWFYYQRARHNMNSENYDRAEKDYGKLVTLGLPPKDQSNMLSKHALALLQLDRLDEAEKQCNKALEINPNHFYALASLFKAKAAQKDKAGAKTIIDRLRKLGTDNPEALSILSELTFAHSYYEQSIPILLDYLKVKPKNSRTALMLGHAFRVEKDLENAVKWYKNCFAYDTTKTEALNWLKIVHTDMGREEKFLDLLETLTAGVELPNIYRYKAYMYRHYKWCMDAADNYLKAAQLSEGDDAARLNAQAVYVKEDCIELYRKDGRLISD